MSELVGVNDKPRDRKVTHDGCVLETCSAGPYLAVLELFQTCSAQRQNLRELFPECSEAVQATL